MFLTDITFSGADAKREDVLPAAPKEDVLSLLLDVSCVVPRQVQHVKEIKCVHHLFSLSGCRQLHVPMKLCACLCRRL